MIFKKGRMMARDMSVLTSTSKMLSGMGQVNQTSKTLEIQFSTKISMEPSENPIQNEKDESWASPKPALTPDMADLLTNILNRPDSKKYHPKE